MPSAGCFDPYGELVRFQLICEFRFFAVRPCLNRLPIKLGGSQVLGIPRKRVGGLPTCFGLVEHEGSSIEKSSFVLQMECRDRDITKQLNLHVHRLKVHKWRPSFPAANLIEDGFECPLKFSTSVCALGEPAGIEHGSIIGERQADEPPTALAWGSFAIVAKPGSRETEALK